MLTDFSLDLCRWCVVLPCEATTMAGTGKLALTGSLGKVMQESGHAAMSYIRLMQNP